ncbi:MAG: hypothetical protein ACRDTT_30045 [Pseudonocardiaceae bacterium]
MRGTTRRVQAARGYLARPVAVVGVLAGLVLGNGVQCTDDMTAMAIEHVASSGMAVGAAQDDAAPAAKARVERYFSDQATAAEPTLQITAVCVVPGAAAVSPLAGDGSPGSPGQGGVLACLAFIVAVVAVIVGLRPPWLRTFVLVLMPRRAAVIRTVHPRAPSLAELCLLRT